MNSCLARRHQRVDQTCACEHVRKVPRAQCREESEKEERSRSESVRPWEDVRKQSILRIHEGKAHIRAAGRKPCEQSGETSHRRTGSAWHAAARWSTRARCAELPGRRTAFPEGKPYHQMGDLHTHVRMQAHMVAQASVQW